MKLSHIVIVFITFSQVLVWLFRKHQVAHRNMVTAALTREFLNGLPHGNGTYELPNGYRYVGEWFEGEINGQGEALFPNGSVYIGSL